MKKIVKFLLATDVLLPIIGVPVISLLAFYISYVLDPSTVNSSPGILSLYVSIVILLISQWLSVIYELKQTTTKSKESVDAIKDHLHIISIGTPDKALGYISSRLSAIRYVYNTTLNTSDEAEVSDERFYSSQAYQDLQNKITECTRDGLLWKDVGDSYAKQRMLRLHQACKKKEGENHGYLCRVISHDVPQINFIILEYKNEAQKTENPVQNDREVLFNWDFRRPGDKDPIVMLSRDVDFVGMFSTQFDLLWKASSVDHDIHSSPKESLNKPQ